MKTYTILVAFHVNGTGHVDAAKRLADILAESGVLDHQFPGLGQVVESWWMPNEPAADGSDNEAVALFHEISYDGASDEHERQLVATASLRALRAAFGKT